MATTAPYTPPSMTKARSRLGLVTRNKENGTAVAEARADMAVNQLIKAIDKAVDAGASLDAPRLEFINTYLGHRLAKAGE
ncbi:hypothetical protein [Corynebacterium sp. c24Ua_83]|uniref:hypothetical protein n=1 Tax=Corynebacterium sp. c24Ua_83 TaxID=3032350 RepID=UPI0032633414